MIQTQQRDAHIQVRDSNLLEVSIRSLPNGSSEPDPTPGITAQLLDLSVDVVRMRVEELLQDGMPVRLTVATKGEDRLECDGSVCWAEPASSAGWITGFQLTEPLSDEVIDELATIGALERRDDQRQLTSLSAEAKTELKQEFKSAHIIDISEGGFCLLSEDRMDAKVGERLMTRFTDQESPMKSVLVRARVAWSNVLDDGETVGCTFLTRADHMQLRRILNMHSDELCSETDDSEGAVTSWLMVAAAIAVIVFVLFL